MTTDNARETGGEETCTHHASCITHHDHTSRKAKSSRLARAKSRSGRVFDQTRHHGNPPHPLSSTEHPHHHHLPTHPYPRIQDRGYGRRRGEDGTNRNPPYVTLVCLSSPMSFSPPAISKIGTIHDPLSLHLLRPLQGRQTFGCQTHPNGL